ncbi:hypothetical protein NDU88_003181 [Pleurodeles waltl]|uniref:Uncharacterized protein n=1 Tax=Pleurodeles waltl TaxID=8319 RepID=A0AAV7SE29_PLEWA|nr:hypothetical protein NDU88_003181 [Pleurodeles waltl]
MSMAIASILLTTSVLDPWIAAMRSTRDREVSSTPATSSGALDPTIFNHGWRLQRVGVADDFVRLGRFGSLFLNSFNMVVRVANARPTMSAPVRVQRHPESFTVTPEIFNKQELQLCSFVPEHKGTTI